MIILIILIFAILVAVSIAASLKITSQASRIDELKREKAKISDALRRKGIEVDRLMRKIEREK